MNTCRACLSGQLLMYLPLGLHPPANAFLRAEQLRERELLLDLNTHVCVHCGLVQIPDQIPAGFFEHYLYVPSASDTMHRHFDEFAQRIRQRFLPGERDLLVDIGCNDGLFLNAVREMGVATLGIDPAANLTKLANQKGIATITGYFGLETGVSARSQYGPAQVIVTTNTFNHVGDLHAFMRGIDALLAPDGVFIVEVPQAVRFIEHNEFDTIYHEHLSVFSVKSLVELYRQFDMSIFDIQELPVHGGSMRVFARRGETQAPVTEEWLEREESAGLFKTLTYESAAVAARTIRDRLLALLAKLKSAGQRIAGYGAPAKGNTLLNYCRIGPDTLEYLADRSPLKHGLYSPGMHIPIVGPDTLVHNPPDYLLLLAWNFAEEIIEQQATFRKQGGKFIIPIPEPVIAG
jgi:SAM-dependent methyltransferase